MADKYPSMSAYMYTAGNPINLIDPIGLSPDDPPAGANPDEYSSGGNTTMPSGIDPSLEPETPQGYYYGNGKKIPNIESGSATSTSSSHEHNEYIISVWIYHGRFGEDMGNRFGGHTMLSFGGEQAYGFTGNYGASLSKGVRETSNGFEWDSKIHGSEYYGTVLLFEAGLLLGSNQEIVRAGLWTRIDIKITPLQYYAVLAFYEANLGKAVFPFHIITGQNCSKSAFNTLKDNGIVNGSAFFHALTPSMFHRFLLRQGYQSKTFSPLVGLNAKEKSIINYNTRAIKKIYG